MKKFYGLLFFLYFHWLNIYAQWQSDNFQLGYGAGVDTNVTCENANINYSTGVAVFTPETRKMKFEGAEANYSDSSGQIIIATNGIWIADATGDTMMNGSGLNPNTFTNDWASTGLPIAYQEMILPQPGSDSLFTMFHMTGDYQTNWTNPSRLYYSIIDMSLNNGKGGVTLKNQILFQDSLIGGMAACRDANGRDWWILIAKDSSDLVYKVLFTPSGYTVSTQHTNIFHLSYGNISNMTFSRDGTKFVYSGTIYTGASWLEYLYLFDFDRCTGMLSNLREIDCSDTHPGFGLAFSPNSKYLYACSTVHVFQINTDTSTIVVDTVATNDGYYSPFPPLLANFWNMFLANDNKIYISTGNSTVVMHMINQPDSGGTTCDVQLHGFRLPCYHAKAIPNFPNYNLHALTGSVCDTILNEIDPLVVATLKIYPNPSNGSFYLVNDNKHLSIEGFNSFGEKVELIILQEDEKYKVTLKDPVPGMYRICIRSSGFIRSKTILVY